LNKGLWIARKNYLYCLIKKVSDGYGGDDVDFLNQHFNEVLKAYPDEHLEVAITCYTEMVEKLKYYTHQ